MAELSQTVATLRASWSLDFARVRRALTALVEGATLSGLVAASGLPRRDVEVILRELEPFVKTDGDQHHLHGLDVLQRSAREHPVPADGTAGPVTSEPALAELMAGLAAGLPPSRWRLDHVLATPETMARRALYLAGEYELDGASVLCLGDHDLTSLAVCSAVPGAELTVVDIDEPILDHISDSAARLAVPVTAAWADLRLVLPPSLVGTADLVFTDPPYTTEGIRLFLTRALEALRPTGHERLAFCFGTGERHLVKALEVQSLLSELRLALEAMLPGFNHYAGAEAIGARSDLYICRPTTGAKVGDAALAARASRSSRRKATARIYTRGAAAEEAPARTLPEAIATAALAAAGDPPLVLFGEGWESADPGAAAPLEDRSSVVPDAAGEPPLVLVDKGREPADTGPAARPQDRSSVVPDAAVPLPDFFGRVAAWATAARPGPFPFQGTLVVNTYPDYGAAALRTLLLAASERAVLILPRRDLPPPGLLAAAYDVASVPAGRGGDPAILLVTRRDRAPADAAEAVLRHVLLHPGAKVVNAWRDALLAVARDAALPMTKNEARARIAADTLPPALRRLRLWELPLSVLDTLPAEIARSATDLH